jgi:hypothetical protein
MFGLVGLTMFFIQTMPYVTRSIPAPLAAIGLVTALANVLPVSATNTRHRSCQHFASHTSHSSCQCFAGQCHKHCVRLVTALANVLPVSATNTRHSSCQRFASQCHKH